MGWIVEYNDGSTTHTYSVTQMSFKKTLVGINSGSFTLTLDDSGVKCPVDVDVTVKLENSVSQTTDPVILYGRTTKVGEYNKGLYNVTIAERANELKNMYVEDDDDAFVVKVGEGTSSGPYITTFVDTILNSGQASDTGWDISIASQTAYGSVYQIPGSSDVIPAQAYINTTCSASLDKFLRDICGLYFWFDNANKKISFGANSGTTHTIDDYILDIKQTDEVTDNAIERIIVISSSTASSGAKYSGTAISDTAIAPYKTVMYQYDTATSNSDCVAIANQLLAESEDTKVRYEVTLPNDSDGLLINEADKVSIDGTSYLVQDVTISMNKIVLGINSRANNFTDIISSNLSIVNGEGGLESVTTTWDGGEQNIGKSVPAEYNFYIKDKDLLGDTVPMELQYNPWKKSLSVGSGGYSTAYTENAYTSITTTAEATVTGTNQYYSVGGTGEYNVSNQFDFQKSGDDGWMPFMTTTNHSYYNPMEYDILAFRADTNELNIAYCCERYFSIDNSMRIYDNSTYGGYDTVFVEVDFGVYILWYHQEDSSVIDANYCDITVKLYAADSVYYEDISTMTPIKTRTVRVFSPNSVTGTGSSTAIGDILDQGSSHNFQFLFPTIAYDDSDTYYRVTISMEKKYDYYDYTYSTGSEDYTITKSFYLTHSYAQAIAYKAHTHTWSAPDHVNPISDQQHQNEFDYDHSNHDEEDDLEEVGTGVVSPTLTVNGTSLTLSGSGNSYSITDIKDYLNTGDNTIALGSAYTNVCSVQPTIVYDIFG